MNLSFRETPQRSNTKIEDSPNMRAYSSEQLQLLEEKRASDWLHKYVKESVTEESKEHDKHLVEKMFILDLTADDYEFFVKNYSRLSSTNKNTLH